MFLTFINMRMRWYPIGTIPKRIFFTKPGPTCGQSRQDTTRQTSSLHIGRFMNVCNGIGKCINILLHDDALRWTFVICYTQDTCLVEWVWWMSDIFGLTPRKICIEWAIWVVYVLVWWGTCWGTTCWLWVDESETFELSRLSRKDSWMLEVG